MMVNVHLSFILHSFDCTVFQGNRNQLLADILSACGSRLTTLVYSVRCYQPLVGTFLGHWDISRSPVESSSVDSRYDLDIVPAEAGGEERQHALVAAAELQEVLAPLALVLVIQNSAEIIPDLSIRVF